MAKRARLRRCHQNVRGALRKRRWPALDITGADCPGIEFLNEKNSGREDHPDLLGLKEDLEEGLP